MQYKILHIKIAFLLSLFFMISCGEKERKEVQILIQQRPNILFIPIDDLRPEIGAYGNQVIHTPNMDKIAEKGVTFMRAYTQQALCNPSRASLLTGVRPDSLQVWDLNTNFRDYLKDIVTLPQFFKENGYITIGLGKTFHNVFPDTISWTKKPHPQGFPFDPDAVYASEKNLEIQNKKTEMAIENGVSKDVLGFYYTKAEAYEYPDVDDDVYFDGAQTTAAVKIIKEELKDSDKPFFLSVGYYRPHLPFNAPKKYWDIYDPEDIPLADNQYPTKDSPAYSVHGDVELRNYTASEDLPLPQEKPWTDERQRTLLHGYYASISYVDAQIGRLLDALDETGLSENTIIVLWGDHGWKLGEHNGWGKMSNFEIDTRVPLIIGGKNVKRKGAKTDALTEFVDVYPSLLEMAGFETPKYLAGKSFVSLLENPDQKWKDAAYSQYLLGRFGKVTRIPGEIMGYTVRTDRYRYVEWYSWNKDRNSVSELLSKELFDHDMDPKESQNLANRPENNKLIQELHEKLKLQFKEVK